VRWLGVPLRRHFAPAPYRPAAAETTVLVLGGSQGALAINEAVPAAVASLSAQALPLRVIHQTGRGKDASVRHSYRELGIADGVEVVPFIDDVARVLGGVDLVIARAGASSLAEICAVGRPSLLIPYPYAADDHQRRNAESLERAGAAICIPQTEASSARLAHEIGRLAREPERRRRMAERALGRGRPEAAREVARDLLELAGAGPALRRPTTAEPEPGGPRGPLRSRVRRAFGGRPFTEVPP